MPEWHLEIIRARLAEYEADPDAVIPWDEVEKRLDRLLGATSD